MDIFIKIVQNNLGEREVTFNVFDTFLSLMPVKSESFKISLQTNINIFYYSGITLSNKKNGLFKIIDKLDIL